MTNFVLIYSGGGMPESEEDKANMMVAWIAWGSKMSAAIVDGGNPFCNAKNVSDSSVGDGSASSLPVKGYTIISAESLDAAVEMVHDHPHLNYGGHVTVYETMQIKMFGE